MQTFTCFTAHDYAERLRGGLMTAGPDGHRDNSEGRAVADGPFEKPPQISSGLPPFQLSVLPYQCVKAVPSSWKGFEAGARRAENAPGERFQVKKAAAAAEGGS